MLKFCGKESGKSRGLRGNVGYVGAWFTWVHGCVGYVGQIFLRGSNFFLHGSLRASKFFTWVQNFWVGQFFFTFVNFYLLDEIILLYYN